jgi:hypothetical protein
MDFRTSESSRGLPYVHGCGPSARRVASFAGRDGSQLFATIHWPLIALASGEHNHSIGATMIAGSSIARRNFSGAMAGTIAISVMPPGKSALTVVPSSSRADTAVAASNAALDGHMVKTRRGHGLMVDRDVDQAAPALGKEMRNEWGCFYLEASYRNSRGVAHVVRGDPFP